MFCDIIVENLNKTYGNQILLENFNYEFKYGSITCLMGTSGIGKTTLVRILLGLENPDSGKIIGNAEYSVVFQENRLVESLSSFVNVKMVTKDNITNDKIVNHLLQIVDKECINKKVSELSGGMKRRIAIVRAILADSDVVIMDEPFTGLDEETKKNVVKYIRENLNGRTLIIVTHNEQDVIYFDAKVCRLERQ